MRKGLPRQFLKACKLQTASWQDAGPSSSQGSWAGINSCGNMVVSALEHHIYTKVMLSDGRAVTRTAELSLHCPLLSLWRTLEECWQPSQLPSAVLVVLLQSPHTKRTPRKTCPSSVTLTLYQPTQLHPSDWPSAQAPSLCSLLLALALESPLLSSELRCRLTLLP